MEGMARGGTRFMRARARLRAGVFYFCFDFCFDFPLIILGRK